MSSSHVMSRYGHFLLLYTRLVTSSQRPAPDTKLTDLQQLVEYFFGFVKYFFSAESQIFLI